MAEVGSTTSLHYWWNYVKAEPAGPAWHLACLPLSRSTKPPQFSPTLRDNFQHVTDSPHADQSHRRWGTLPNGAKFEISLPVEVLPASVLGRRR